MGKNQHITPNGKGSWQLKGDGNSKATKYFDTQAEAITYGRQVANDNCPPKDTEH